MSDFVRNSPKGGDDSVLIKFSDLLDILSEQISKLEESFGTFKHKIVDALESVMRDLESKKSQKSHQNHFTP